MIERGPWSRAENFFKEIQPEEKLNWENMYLN